jgi:hypothetical protein
MTSSKKMRPINGIKSCEDPALLQRLADGLTAEKIERLLRKWLRRLPHPFPARDRAAGYRYDAELGVIGKVRAEFQTMARPERQKSLQDLTKLQREDFSLVPGSDLSHDIQ